jgi:hypothetical protein
MVDKQLNSEGCLVCFEQAGIKISTLMLPVRDGVRVFWYAGRCGVLHTFFFVSSAGVSDRSLAADTTGNSSLNRERAGL